MRPLLFAERPPHGKSETGAETGTDHVITITNDLAASHQDLIRPDFSGTAIQSAADASLTLGSGPGAMTITRSTNEIDDLIDGVTLKLVGADPSQDGFLELCGRLFHVLANLCLGLMLIGTAATIVLRPFDMSFYWIWPCTMKSTAMSLPRR